MMCKKHIFARGAAIFTLSLVVIPVKAQSVFQENCLEDLSYQLALGGGEEFGVINFQQDCLSATGFNQNAIFSFQDYWNSSLDQYGAEISDFSALGISHVSFSKMDYGMEEFYFYYRNGSIMDESELVQLANRNTLTATDINRELSSWEESDYYLVSHHEVQIIEVSKTIEPEFITVGVLEPVPEPSTALLLALSALFIMRRRR